MKDPKARITIWDFPIFEMKIKPGEGSGNPNNNDNTKNKVDDNRNRLYGFLCLMKMAMEAGLLLRSSADDVNRFVKTTLEITDGELADQLVVEDKLIHSDSVRFIVEDVLRVIPGFCNPILTPIMAKKQPPNQDNIRPKVVTILDNPDFMCQSSTDDAMGGELAYDSDEVGGCQLDVHHSPALFLLLLDAGVLIGGRSVGAGPKDNAKFLDKMDQQYTFANAVQPFVNGRKQELSSSKEWEQHYSKDTDGFKPTGDTIHAVVYSRARKPGSNRPIDLSNGDDNPEGVANTAGAGNLDNVTDPFAANDKPNNNSAFAPLYSSALATEMNEDAVCSAQTVNKDAAQRFYLAMVSPQELW